MARRDRQPPTPLSLPTLTLMDALVSRRHRRLLLAATAAAASGYGLYRLYRHHRRRVAAVLSLADAVSQVGSDLADFLRSDSDHVPRSLLQLSKLAASDPISSAASSLSESLAAGLLRALSSSSSSHRDTSTPLTAADSASCSPTLRLTDRILDRLLSPAGTGFASALVGTFATNLVLSYHAAAPGAGDPRPRSQPDWLTALCSDRGKDATADLVRVFVTTAVAAYLDRTASVPRTSHHLLAAFSDPKHEAKLKDLLVSVCNGAVETFIRTTRQVSREASLAPIQPAVVLSELQPQSSSPRCVMDTVSSTLAVPSNRRFVLDVTGRVTAETVRSFLEFLAQRVSDGARKSIATARNEVAERGFVAIKYMTAKSMAIFTICFALCMHISMGTRFLLPA
uniref:Protein PHLOEM PROTEIN 2-LIKE A10 n=1 Tax=Oryza punctata TaxID=4537 RepID=A0A0E0M4X3_ORYPU